MGLKKVFTAILFVTMFFSLTSCQNSGDTNEPTRTLFESTTREKEMENSNTEKTDSDGGKILMAYFSRLDNITFDADIDAVASATVNLKNGDYIGNNAILAEMASELTDGDIFSIQTVKTYPSKYRDTTDMAIDEQKAKRALNYHLMWKIWRITIPLY